MDRSVTIRFYEVTQLNATENLSVILDRIEKIKPKSERQKDLKNDVVIRMESLNIKPSGLYVGDLTRIQSQNLPSKVTGSDTDPFPFSELGHYVAFCFDPKSNVIALQFNQKVRVGKALYYFGLFSDEPSYSYLPILTEASVGRLFDENIKRFTTKVSRVTNFQPDDDATDFEIRLNQMSEMFDGPTVEVTISSRLKDKSLFRDNVVKNVRRLLKLNEDNEGYLKSLKAFTHENEEPYDFLKQMLKEKAILDLPDNDPAGGRKKRLAYAEQSFEKHRDVIYKQMGVL